jgi:hypothetical protein
MMRKIVFMESKNYGMKRIIFILKTRSKIIK